MKTFVSKGKQVEFTAPTGGVVSGTAYLIGSLVVIATHSAAQTLKFIGRVTGAVDHAKPAEEGWTEGVKLYWDDTAKKFTKVVGANTLVGVAIPPIVPAVVTLATNALAADLAISGFTLTVLDFAQLDSDNATVTVTVNGVVTVLTEEVEWNAATSNDATATSLASAINALTGVTATATTNVVTVVPASGIGATSLAIGRVRLDGAAR
jgi:predicted RecA/RadA family phage recombinase